MSVKKTLDKAIRTMDTEIELQEIIDTWRIIEKYNLSYKKRNGKIVINKEEALRKGVSEEYLNRAKNFGRMYGRGDF